MITKYYGLGTSVSAVRREGTGINLGLFWVLGDHLGLSFRLSPTARREAGSFPTIATIPNTAW